MNEAKKKFTENSNDAFSYDEFPLFDALYRRSKQNAIIIFNTEGLILEANQQFTKSFGYTREEIIGEKNSKIFTAEDRMRGLPEIELKKTISDGQANDNNYIVHKNGSPIWVSGESVLVEHSGTRIILKVIQNIHQVKLSEASLRVMNELNENILSSIVDVVLVLDKDHNIIKSNKPIRDLFSINVTPGTENIFDLLKHHPDFEMIRSKIETCTSSTEGFNRTEIEIENSNDDKRIYQFNCCALNNSNERRILLVIHDITEEKHAEREREDIIGFVAHELRNPLANIVLCHEILNDSLKTGNISEMSDMLQRSTNNVMRLNKMIGELYEATKANAGNLRLVTDPFNFGDMIREAVDTIKSLQPYYNIVIQGNGDIIIVGDRYRLLQVVINFLSNGIKYSNGNTIVILSVSHDNENITVAVKDQGLGISASQLPHIFERFFRAEKTRNLEGIGLGLYLCRQIIQQHHGKIWAESEEGRGSTFYFSIPINFPD